MIEKDGQDELTTTYIVKKFIPLLEQELHFARLAPKMKPLTWRQRKTIAVKKYLNTLWLALKGHDFEEDWDY